MVAPPRPRMLSLADAFPWPAPDGYRIRIDRVIRALAQTDRSTCWR